MPETKKQLQRIDLLEMPDEWDSIRHRAPRADLELDDATARARSRPRRPGLAATVLLVTIAVIGAALFGLRGSKSERAVTMTTASGEVVFFPTEKEPSNAYMASLAEGTLVEEQGCIFLGADPRPGSHRLLVIWPNQASVRLADDGNLEVFFDGRSYGEIGDHVQLGGGLLSEERNDLDFVQEVIGETVPQRCLADGYFSASPPIP
jgi:hypothetical protein